jgi:surface protein
MRKSTTLAMAVLAFMACDSATAPRGQDPAIRPQAAVSDAAHGGAAGFYFLPPMVKAPSYNGTFDATAAPVVEICESIACKALHATFSMTDGTGSERVRRSDADERYSVNWHTDQTGAVTGNRYRIRVRVGGATLGYADIELAANGRDARNTSGNEAIGLVNGRTLPIAFRIEQQTAYMMGPAGGLITAMNGNVLLDVAESAVASEIAITIAAVIDDVGDADVVPGAIFEFGPSPYGFGAPVTLTIGFDAAALPDGVAREELRMLKLVAGAWVQIPGSAVDLAGNRVTAPLQGFSRYAVGRGKVHSVAVDPPAASLKVGATQQFEATVTNVDGETMLRNVQWSSSDADVATVNGDGLATALAVGDAIIEARVGNVRGQAEVEVTTIVYAISVSPAEATIEVGETQQFTAKVFADGVEMTEDVPAVIWSSSNESVATVSQSGLATGVGEGTVSVSAAHGTADGSAALTVESKAAEPFVTTWNTNLATGTTVTLALAGQVDAVIDWGDGTVRRVTTPGPRHTYSVNGIYTVSVTGRVTAYDGGFYGGQAMLTSVDSWGQVGFTSMARAFGNAMNLVSVPSHSKGLEAVTNMAEMFRYARVFNQDIGGWNTANVTNMSGMFWDAYVFNQDIGGWNTANVTDMSGMFRDARRFNRDIGGWNTANVTNMGEMFWTAVDFNRDIGGWNTANVTNMNNMFRDARAFNQPIGGWNTVSVTRMNAMFYQARAFNQDIGGWNTGNVTSMGHMFYQATAFNQDIGGWNTANVTWMALMFWQATVFNQNIGGWNTGNVIRMEAMFYQARAFNQDIGGWNTANVTNMSAMFRDASVFNQDIGGWKTGKVSDMNAMFYQAAGFNQDLSGWCVTRISSRPESFDYGATSWVLPRPVWGTCPT